MGNDLRQRPFEVTKGIDPEQSTGVDQGQQGAQPVRAVDAARVQGIVADQIDDAKRALRPVIREFYRWIPEKMGQRVPLVQIILHRFTHGVAGQQVLKMRIDPGMEVIDHGGDVLGAVGEERVAGKSFLPCLGFFGEESLG